jgi:hypothetical protein
MIKAKSKSSGSGGFACGCAKINEKMNGFRVENSKF